MFLRSLFIFLYHLIRDPWVLFLKCNTVLKQKIDVIKESPPKDEKNKLSADIFTEQNELMILRDRYLLLVCFAHILGGIFMLIVRRTLYGYARFVTHFNITLFVLTASLRPFHLLLDHARDCVQHIQNFDQIGDTERTDYQNQIMSLHEEIHELKEVHAEQISRLTAEKSHLTLLLIETQSSIKNSVKNEKKNRSFLQKLVAEAKLQKYWSMISWVVFWPYYVGISLFNVHTNFWKQIYQIPQFIILKFSNRKKTNL